MIKIAFCLRRLPDLTHHEFLRHWHVQFHSDLGPLAEKLRAFRDSAEAYDRLAEIWYESREALETLGKDANARAASRALREDERRFIDLSRSPIWSGEEKEIFPAASR